VLYIIPLTGRGAQYRKEPRVYHSKERAEGDRPGGLTVRKEQKIWGHWGIEKKKSVSPPVTWVNIK